MMPKELSVLLRLHHNARYWLYVTNSLALAVFHDAQLQQKKPERFGSLNSMYKVTFGFVTIYL